MLPAASGRGKGEFHSLYVPATSRTVHGARPGLAREEGLEPPTAGFGDRCSTKLSYSRPPHAPHSAKRRRLSICIDVQHGNAASKGKQLGTA